jgi:sortase A
MRPELYNAVGESSYMPRPGWHSHNTGRISAEDAGSDVSFTWLKLLFLVLGLGCVGFYLYGLTDQYVYQAYENWAFDQEIAGRTGITFCDYLRERTLYGLIWGTKSKTAAKSVTPTSPAESQSLARLEEGDIVARISISRLNLAAMVREGVSDKTLRTAVGHVPSTALPGQAGNFAIAAHRDTLFRALKDIRKGDQVVVQSSSQTYIYQVIGTKIVKPTDVSVLRADGGGIDYVSAAAPASKLLTMITCYPFYYVGSAPQRFIVEGRLISTKPLS